MTNFEQQYALWDEFLETWPISKLEKMTLDEYTQAGSRETFTYWLVLVHKLRFQSALSFADS
ncbi:MAG: hypothetical protein F4X09_08885, partial [Gammaproteobacteria bacterium]|nr:hypothetical protein [Gammaproteobacteria bacterium]